MQDCLELRLTLEDERESPRGKEIGDEARRWKPMVQLGLGNGNCSLTGSGQWWTDHHRLAAEDRYLCRSQVEEISDTV